MSKFTNPLTDIKIASPCPADWNEMYGSERKRFCGECKLNVYNLSGMTTDDAEALIMNAEGRLCVRFFRRADGTVLTADCPVGWARVKQRARLVATAAFSMLMALFSGVFIVSMFSKNKAIPIVGRIVVPTSTPEDRYTTGVMINRKEEKGEVATPVERKLAKTMPEGKQAELKKLGVR